MAYKIRFTKKADKAIRSLDKPVAERVISELDLVSHLVNPKSRGKALTGTLAGLWRYRVGNWRIICDIEQDVLVVLVVDVGHRNNIYKRQY